MNKTLFESNRLNKLTRSIKLASFAALSLVYGTEVQAQLTLEEIVVTAQKREESLQDVPIAVSALSESALQQSGFDGVQDLSFMVPSLQFSNFGSNTQLTMRGIGSENTTGGSDPGVALHVDGVYVGRPVGALFTAFDMERVEVLRGPQGTLYGRNATGGSVNLITRKPDDEFGGQVDATLGDYNRVRLRGAVNLPISDSASARLVAFSEDRDGFTSNSVPGGTEAGDADDFGVRGHLSLDLSDNASLLLSATYIDNGGVGSQPEQRDAFSSPFGGPGPEPLRTVPFTNDLTPFSEGNDAAEETDNQFALVSATLDWDFENFSVKSITGYIDSQYRNVQDNDESPAPLHVITLNESSEQFSQEIQFISNENSPFQWIAGLYYFKEDVVRFTDFTGARFEAVQGFLAANVPGFDADFSLRLGGDIETTSFAVFGQSTFDLSDTVALTVGLRYTDDEKEGVNRNVFFAPTANDPVGTSSEEVTGRLALDWSVSDTSLAYFSYARGYKSGGINQTTRTQGGLVSAEFRPEFADTYELGLKSRLFDDRLQLNIAAYSNEYTDLQFQIFGDVAVEAGNAGEATINGLEVEWQALLSDNWSFDGSFAYTDATYDELIIGPGAANDFSGNTLTRTPDITYNLGLNGSWDLSDGSNLTARLEGSFTDEIYYEFRNTDVSLASDYYNANFRVFWTSADEVFTVEGYVTNLTDEVQEGNILIGLGIGNRPGDTGPEFVTYNAPRQYGVTLGYNF